ncbi:hypothetical protein BDW62DRAFT_212278 [Aspergillus aurantiobrunneus]
MVPWLLVGHRDREGASAIFPTEDSRGSFSQRDLKYEKYEWNTVHHDEHHLQTYEYLENAVARRSASATIVSRALMDDLRAPNLAAKSLDLQTREIFNTLVSDILFPATYAAFRRRVDQDIIAFVRDDRRAQCPAMEWLVRCYAAWYFAKLHNDEAKLSESRYIYGVLLRYIRNVLDDPRKRTADVTLAIALLLGIYEVLDGSSPEGWLVHMKGIKELLRQRGAAAHFKGFGRTLLLACRGFFIAEAFVNQESCILAEPDWVDLNAKAFEREDRVGRGSKLVSLLDHTYREIVLVPGLVAQVRAAVDPDLEEHNSDGLPLETPCIHELRMQIQRSRGALRRLRRRLSSAIGSDELMAPHGINKQFVESRYAALIARYNLQGLHAVGALLDQVFHMLETKSPSDSKGVGTGPVRISPSVRREVKMADVFEEPVGADVLAPGSLDDMFLTMGAMTISTDE